MKLSLEDFIYECNYKGKKETWIYAGDEEYRFVLGKCGTNPLICFGINPSNACITGIRDKSDYPTVKSDPTMYRVRNITRILGFDGYIMLNICPYINKNPSALKEISDEYSYEKNVLNMTYIEKVFEKYSDSRVLWACWGKSIVNANFLIQSLEQINEVAEKHNMIWKTVKWTIVEPRHPHHPLRISNDEVLRAKKEFYDVDMAQYIRMLKGEK